MPHFNIEYSSNLENTVDFTALCNILRLAAIKTKVFPVAGIRVRATPCPHFSIADGDPQHGFIDITVRLRAGRPIELRKSATADLFKAVETLLAPIIARQSIALSMEMRNIDPDLSPKTGSIRKFIKAESP